MLKPLHGNPRQATDHEYRSRSGIRNENNRCRATRLQKIKSAKPGHDREIPAYRQTKPSSLHRHHCSNRWCFVEGFPDPSPLENDNYFVLHHHRRTCKRQPAPWLDAAMICRFRFPFALTAHRLSVVVILMPPMLRADSGAFLDDGLFLLPRPLPLLLLHRPLLCPLLVLSNGFATIQTLFPSRSPQGAIDVNCFAGQIALRTNAILTYQPNPSLKLLTDKEGCAVLTTPPLLRTDDSRTAEHAN